MSYILHNRAYESNTGRLLFIVLYIYHYCQCLFLCYFVGNPFLITFCSRCNLFVICAMQTNTKNTKPKYHTGNKKRSKKNMIKKKRRRKRRKKKKKKIDSTIDAD